MSGMRMTDWLSSFDHLVGAGEQGAPIASWAEGSQTLAP
jgi:hypothetical protein